MKKLFLFALLSLPVAAHAQWQTVATYGQSVTIPVGVLVRWGSTTDNLWAPYKQYLTGKTYSVGGGEFPTNPDPQVPANTLVLQVYQIPIQQTIRVAGATINIPASDVSTGIGGAPQPGTPAYCNTGLAKTAQANIVVSASTGTITSGNLPCN